MAEEMKDFAELKKTQDAMAHNDAEVQQIENFGNGFAMSPVDEPDEVMDDAEVGLIINEAEEKKATAPAEKPHVASDGVAYPEPSHGVILDKKVIPDRVVQKKGLAVGAMANKERAEDVELTMMEVDDKIAAAREQAQKLIAQGHKPEKEINDPNAPKEIQDSNTAIHQKAEAEAANQKQETEEEKAKRNEEEVTILIDKIGLGNVEFTEEEKARIEYSKKINLVEVENKNLQTLKVKKKVSNKKSFKLMERNYNKGLAPVIALASGYMCKMKNIYASEAMRMIQQPGEETANSLLDKWSEIYKRIVDVSVGEFKDFEDFCHRTAFVDYDHFLYAMICSSYPEAEALPFNCDKNNKGCGKDFSVDYTNRDMIRKDEITNEIRVNIAQIIDNAPFVDKARAVADTFPVNNTKRFVLNDQGTIVELYLPSVYETIENVFKRIDADHSIIEDESNRQHMLLAQGVKNIYDVDYEDSTEDEPCYIQIEGLEAIIERMNKMSTRELRIIALEMEKMSRPYTIRYGFKEVVCPHCGRNWGEYTMSLDDILFQRVRQSATAEISLSNTDN